MADSPLFQTDRAVAQWQRLIAIVLATTGSSAPDVPPATLAAAANKHAQTAEYEEAIASALAQLARVLQQETGDAVDGVRRRVTVLIRTLGADTLQRLLRFGGDTSQRREFLLEAIAAFEPEAVIRLVLAAARVSWFQLSPPLAALLVKIAHQAAEADEEQLRAHSQAALRDLTDSLVQEWWPIDTSSASWGLTEHERIEAISSNESPGAAGSARVVQLSLEIGEGGAPLVAATHDMLEHGGYRELAALLQKSPDSAAVDAVLEQIARPSRLLHVLREEPVDFELVQRMVARIGQPLAPVLLDELAESESRATRRGIFDRLVELGPGIAPLVADRLKDNRWFVQRNLLALLAELRHWPDGLSARPLLNHSDPRVRKEAVRLMLSLPTPGDDAVAAALRDKDAQVVRLGLNRLRESWSEPLAVKLAAQLAREDFPAPLRSAALRLLRGARAESVLDVLLRHASGGRGLLGKPKLAPKSPELLAALSVLAAHWQSDTRAAALLARARKARDSEIRAAASRTGVDT